MTPVRGQEDRNKTDCFESPETVLRLFRTLFGLRSRKAPGDSWRLFRDQGPAGPGRLLAVRGGRGCKQCHLDGAFPAELFLWNCLRKSCENQHVECEFHCENQKYFWRGPKTLGRARSLVRFFLPPYVLHPPYHGPKDDVEPLLSNSSPFFFRKILVSVKFCPHFWGRRWVRQFYGRLEFLLSFRRKTSIRIKFRGGGHFGFWGGGVPILFLWARGILLNFRCPPLRYPPL